MAGPTRGAGVAMTGHVHGGQQPITGAAVYMFEAGLNGYGGAAVSDLDAAAITANGAAGGGTDGTGYFVFTDANGYFTITGGYSCTEGMPVYLLAAGGNPGLSAGTNNRRAVQIAALGLCPSGGFSSSLEIVIDEVTTVAAVYALSGFLTEPVSFESTLPGFSIPAGDPEAMTGVTNAIANAGQLADITTGMALAATPNGNGLVPQAEINTLADIIAACVNSDGQVTDIDGQPTACYQVLHGVSGSEAGDVTGLLLDVVGSPGLTTVTNLFPLSSKTAPFQPTLDTPPNDFTVSIVFSGGDLDSPGIPAVDEDGNVWFPNTSLGGGGTATLSMLSPQGVPLEKAIGLGTLAVPTQAAVDDDGDIWVAFSSGGVVAKVTYSPPHITHKVFDVSAHSVSSDADVHQIALDSFSNVYISDYTNKALYKLDVQGAAAPGYVLPSPHSFTDVAVLSDSFIITSDGGTHAEEFTDNGANVFGGFPPACGLEGVCGLDAPYAFAVDSSGNVWATNSNNTIDDFDPNAKEPVAGSPFTGGGLKMGTGTAEPAVWLAIDGGGNVWVPSYKEKSVAEFDNSGTALSPGYGFMSELATCAAQGLAVDSSGDVWVSCDSEDTPVLEFIGAAVPVHTPLTPGFFGVRP